MKTLARIVLAMVYVVIIMCALFWARDARGQSGEVLRVLQHRGWHGVGGNVQVHQPTLDAAPPWIGAWERSPIGDQYGDWMYVKILINCEQWSQIPFATLDADDNMVLIGDLTGEMSAAVWPQPGTEPFRTMTAVCGLYGYSRPKLPAMPDPRNHLERLDR